MIDQGTSTQPIYDPTLRVILQKLDSVTSILKDTQMRVQKLEEDKDEASVQDAIKRNQQVAMNLVERPWIFPKQGENQGNEHQYLQIKLLTNMVLELFPFGRRMSRYQRKQRSSHTDWRVPATTVYGSSLL